MGAVWATQRYLDFDYFMSWVIGLTVDATPMIADRTASPASARSGSFSIAALLAAWPFPSPAPLSRATVPTGHPGELPHWH